MIFIEQINVVLCNRDYNRGMIESCKLVLSFESVDKILRCDHRPTWENICYLLQVFIHFYFIEKLSLVCTHTPLKVKRVLLFYSSNDLVTPSHGTIFSPFWPLKYPPQAECRWQFSPPLGKIVRLFFTSGVFEGNKLCRDPSRLTTDDDLVVLSYGTVI